MNKTIDYFIDSKKDLASFEYYFEEELNIKSVTLKRIMFYNSWWTGDSFANAILYMAITDIKKLVSWKIISTNIMDILSLNPDKLPDQVNTNTSSTEDFSIHQRHFSLAEFCSKWEDNIKKHLDHVKIYCDQNNYIIIELLEDKEFSIEMIFNKEIIEREDILTPLDEGGRKDLGDITKELYTKITKYLNNAFFGFKQEKFTKRGKYYSTKPLNFYRTSLLLRSNLVDKQNTFYNNKYSDIFCEFPVDDGDQIKLQTYEPPNCTKNVNKCTNRLKFEITDENGKVINFRGKPVKIHLSFEVFPFLNDAHT